MALIAADRVKETSTTTGTGAFTLAGAATGYRAFSAVMSVSDTCWYTIQLQGGSEWEVGLGTYSSANTLTRTTVYASSNSGSAVNFSAGTKDVFITLPASQVQPLGGASGRVFFTNDQTVTANYTIPTGQNAGSFGTITINSGVTVTVPSGSTWTVV